MRRRTPLLLLPFLLATACSSTPEEDEGPRYFGHESVATDPVDDEGLSAAGLEEDPTNGVHPAEASAPTQPARQGGSLSQAERDLDVRRQRQSFLAGEYIKQGDALLDQADLGGALEAYASALEVDPASTVARDQMRKVLALQGDVSAVAGETMREYENSETVRRAQARLEAEQAVETADQDLRDGKYDPAVQLYRQALLIFQYHPLISDENLDERVVSSKLETALGLQDEARRVEADMRAESARVAKEEREAQERAYKRGKLRTIYQEARSAFLSENYRRAEALCSQILLDDPENQVAMSLRDTAQAARHHKAGELQRRNYREQWIRTFEELDMMDVPQIDPIVFDDIKRWNEVRQRKPHDFGTGEAPGGADLAAVEGRLASVRFAPRFIGPDGEGAPLDEVAAYLQNLTGVNFIVSTRVREDLDEEETTIKLQLPERSVGKVLDIIAETSEFLRWKIEDGIVKFVTQEELTGGQVLRMYEVRDIIHPIPDFPGRDINVMPSGGLEPTDEDFEEREGLVVTADALDALIRDNIATESWDLDPNNSLRITESGTLVVNQTPEVQEMILTLLDDLREATGIMVDIQTRFLKVEDNFLEDIGVDFRGLGQPGLGTNAFFNDFGDPSTQSDLGQEIGQGTDLGAFFDEGGDGDLRARVENLYDLQLGETDVLTGAGGLSFQWTFLNDLQMELILRAVSKSERIELVTAPRLLVFNTARANITVLNQVAYVQDFDVEIAQAASIADPIIGVVQDGVVLDVRPVVSADRRFVMMELRPTVAELQRPIPEVATSLGSQNSVTIQLPEVDIQRVRTTVPMPDGGTVLLGGLKVSEKKDLNSGVPILNKIPILSFLFERKGTFVSNRKLLILLRAQIVIPEEFEPTSAQLGS